jgi:hypothetical protein
MTLETIAPLSDDLTRQPASIGSLIEQPSLLSRAVRTPRLGT